MVYKRLPYSQYFHFDEDTIINIIIIENQKNNAQTRNMKKIIIFFFNSIYAFNLSICNITWYFQRKLFYNTRGDVR